MFIAQQTILPVPTCNPSRQSFEQLLIAQAHQINRATPNQFIEVLKALSLEAMEWFELDRITLFPNSMLLLNDGRTLTNARAGHRQLDINNYLRSNYKEYLDLLRSRQPWQYFNQDQLRQSQLSTLNCVYEEGAFFHGIIRLEMFGQTWGAISLSRFTDEHSDFCEQDFQRLKLLSDRWLSYWQHATISLGLTQGTKATSDESDKLLRLSKKQCAVLALLAQGNTAKQCAEKLFLSPRTIESHKYRMLDILELDNHTELVRFAMRNGLGLESQSKRV
jgi:DNA-binding CsgD family transcriptional regulator